ncbi:MAG: hypothetical protein H6873_05665 [Hyphomicrobiaceae bacterium]|nr:hypothetical protein [Hyphomicrobiaceae bacterium]
MDPITILLFGLVSLAINVGIGLINQQRENDRLQAAQPAKPRPHGFDGTARLGGEEAISFPVGRCAPRPYLEYARSWGQSPRSVHVLSVSDLPGVSLRKVWGDGRQSNYNSGATAETEGKPLPAFTKSGSNYGWVTWHDGTQTSADSYLSAKFGSLSKQPWQSDMKGRGIAFGIFTARFHKTLFKQIPDWSVEVDGIPLYDPRLDGSEDGTGTHRWDDQSTWETSDNPVVILYNVLRGIKYDDARVWGGTAAYEQLPYASWAAAMDACDASVNKNGGGSEKRYRAGGEIYFSEDPADVVKRFALACNARFATVGDKTYIQIGIPSSDAAAITDDDIVISEDQSGVLFPPVEERINTVTARFSDPDSAWEVIEAPRRQNANYLAEDGGIETEASLDLSVVFSQTQAQRLMKEALEEGRRFRRHVMVLRPEFAGLLPVIHRVSWTSARHGYSSKKFVVTAAEEMESGNIAVTLQEADPNDYDWDETTEESSFETVDLDVEEPDAQEVTAPAATAATVLDSASNAYAAGIALVWDTGLDDDVTGVEVEVRNSTTTETIYRNIVPPGTAGGTTLTGAWAKGGEDVDVRYRYIVLSGRDTTWTSWITVTLPVVPSTAAFDLETKEAIGVITGDSAPDLPAMLDDIRERLNLVSRSIMSNGLYAYNESQGLLAAVARVERAVADGDGALAELVDQAFVRVNNVSADALISFTAVASADKPEDAEVRIALQARKSVDDDEKVAGIYVDILPNGERRVVILVDQFAVTDGTTTADAFTFTGGVLTVREVLFEKLTSIPGGIVINGLSGEERLRVRLT